MNARQITAGICGLAIAMLLGALSPGARAQGSHAHRHGIGGNHDARPSDPAATWPAQAPLPALSARWLVRFEPHGAKAQEQTWELHRSADRIVWSRSHALDEVWQRDASGISLRRVMHPQRHVIEYTAGELRTLGVEKDWRELGMLFAERDLAALKPVGTRARGGPQRLRGTVAGEQVDLLWDAHARLPVVLVQTSPRGRVRYERVAVEPGADTAHAWSGDARSADYTRIDAADFGDMERHPVVRIAMALDERLGWRRAHRH
jgi:hypothetical protein